MLLYLASLTANLTDLTAYAVSRTRWYVGSMSLLQLAPTNFIYFITTRNK